MLKTDGPKKGGDGVDVDSRARHSGSEIYGNDINGGKVEADAVGKKVQKMTKSKNLSKSKKAVRPSNFLIPGAKLAFIKLKQTFLKAPILHHFDPERHIRIETDVSGYAISVVLNQLTSEGR